MRSILLISMLAVACGCTGVYSRRTVGDKPKNPESELKEWNGSWAFNGGVIRAKATDPLNGRLNVCRIEDDKTDSNTNQRKLTCSQQANGHL